MSTEIEQSPGEIAESIARRGLPFSAFRNEAEYKQTLVWLSAEFEKALRGRDERVWRAAAQRLRDKAEEWRQRADRWQRNAQAAGMDIIREQDYADRDVCLSKMSAAITLAIEFDELASAIRGRQ